MLSLIKKILKRMMIKKDKVSLEYTSGGIGHTEESLSRVIRDSYSELCPLIKMQDRLAKVKEEVAKDRENRQP